MSGKLTRPSMDKPKTGRPRLERAVRPPRGTAWPDFDSMFVARDDLWDGVEFSADLEENADAVMGRVKEVFIENEQQKLDDYRTMLNPYFYAVVIFQSEEQKREFLRLAGWLDLGELYIDGLKVAQRMGLDVPPIPLEVKKPKRMPRPLRDVPTLRKGGDS